VIERSLIIGETNEFSVDKSWFSNEPRPADSVAVDHASTERKLIEAALGQVMEKSLDHTARRLSLACRRQLSNPEFAL
jgi:hypothetical protein